MKFFRTPCIVPEKHFSLFFKINSEEILLEFILSETLVIIEYILFNKMNKKHVEGEGVKGWLNIGYEKIKNRRFNFTDLIKKN